MQQFVLTASALLALVAANEVSTKTNVEMVDMPVVRRWKRHCGSQGCAPAVCQECPSCCSMQPTFNINFNCCSAPRPNPSCCSAPAPPPPPPPQPCCGPMQQSCCPPPPPPPPQPTPIICCKLAPVPENPCCQVLAQSPPPVPSSSSCCAAAPVPSNPCCQPVQPMQCTCSAPRPVPCRCGASMAPPSDCPNCDAPAPRCSMMSSAPCTMKRMRRDVHEAILRTVHSMY